MQAHLLLQASPHPMATPLRPPMAAPGRLRRVHAHLLSSPDPTPAPAGPQAAPASALAPLGDYADLYLRGAYDCLHVFRVRELEKIGEAAAEIARRKRAGGTVVSAIGTPHIMYAGACGGDVPGNPNIAPEPNVGFNDGWQGGDLGEGDVLLTANSSAECVLPCSPRTPTWQNPTSRCVSAAWLRRTQRAATSWVWASR